MATRVLIRSGPRPKAANPPPQWGSKWNLILIGQLVSELFMYESVDGRQLESHPISSSGAFDSGELKKNYDTTITYCRPTHITVTQSHRAVTRHQEDLFDLMLTSNLLVMNGRVFLCWTITKLGLMFLLNDTTQWSRNPRPLGLEANTLPLRSLHKEDN